MASIDRVRHRADRFRVRISSGTSGSDETRGRLLEDGSAAVAWIERARGRAQFSVRRVTVDGRRSPTIVVAEIAASRASGFPRVARAGGELLFAWTETSNGQSRVKTAVGLITDGGAPNR